MHPEVESYIREIARTYLKGCLNDQERKGKMLPGNETHWPSTTIIGESRYIEAAEDGVITFDEIYFLGIKEGGMFAAMLKQRDTGEGTFESQMREGLEGLNKGMKAIITGDIREIESCKAPTWAAEGWKLTGELYKLSEKETREKIADIEGRVNEWNWEKESERK